MLSKYHAIFIPLGVALLLLLDARRRRRLLQPGPYLAMAIGLVMFSPVLIWNARHGWVSFLFQGGRAVGGWMPRPDYLVVAMLAQAGYLFPWIWIPLVIMLVRGWRGWSTHSPRIPNGSGSAWRSFPLAVFTAVACFRPVLPHWGLIGLVSLFPMLGRAWAGRTRGPSRGRPPPADRLRRPVPDLDRPGHRRVSGPAGSSGAGPRPLGILDAQKRSDARPLRLGPGGRSDPAARPDRRPARPSSSRATGIRAPSSPTPWAGDRPTSVLQRRRSARIRLLEPARGLDRPRRRPGPGRERARRHRPVLRPRWFAEVEPVSDFWVERNGKPVRRIRLYRCIQQRIAYPFAIDRGHQIARHETAAGKTESTTR